jgi:uncharacterized membrane protein YphA (DoxX/SURF4 family)
LVEPISFAADRVKSKRIDSSRVSIAEGMLLLSFWSGKRKKKNKPFLEVWKNQKKRKKISRLFFYFSKFFIVRFEKKHNTTAAHSSFRMAPSYTNSGALFVGRILVAVYFIIDGTYKTSDQAWPGYRDFIFERFTEMGIQHKNLGYGAFGDMIAACLIGIELLGAVLLLMGFRSYGAGCLVAYLIPMSFVSHKFLVERGVDMKQLLPFLQGMALVGSLIVLGSYSDDSYGEEPLPEKIENTRDLQRDTNKTDFEENELPPFQEGSAFRRRR